MTTFQIILLVCCAWLLASTLFCVMRGWIGKRIRVGLAELEVKEPITRCLATAASTRTGERDADTLGALEAGFGHQHMGVYAIVVKTGDIRQGDAADLIS